MKKRYVIGTYTYEDILTTTWLRRLYGHLLGLPILEEDQLSLSSANQTTTILKNARTRKTRIANNETKKPKTKKNPDPLEKLVDSLKLLKDEVKTRPLRLKEKTKSTPPLSKENLSSLSNKINLLQKQKKKAKGERRFEIQKEISFLREKKKQLQQKLKEAKFQKLEQKAKSPLKKKHTNVEKFLHEIKKQVSLLKSRRRKKELSALEKKHLKKILDLLRSKKLLHYILFSSSKKKRKTLLSILKNIVESILSFRLF